MLTRDQAKTIAKSWITTHATSDVPSTIVDSQTIERSYGWVFFYQSNAYLETQDPGFALAGNAPLIVARATGAVTVTGTAQPAEYYLAQYEAAHGTGAA